MRTSIVTSPVLPVWRQEHYIHSYQADAQGQAYAGAMVHFLQESAWRHAEQLGMGYKALALAGQYWVLSRLFVHFHRFPHWCDTVTVETWPRGLDGVFAMREFRMFGAEGSIIAEASSAWLILDSQTHRPSRSGLACFNGVDLRRDRATEFVPLKITLPDSMENRGSVEVHLSDIDVLKHVNNVRYLNWALDRTPDLYSGASVESVELNFLSESHVGDTIEISRGYDGHTCFFSMTKMENSEACRCKIGLLPAKR